MRTSGLRICTAHHHSPCATPRDTCCSCSSPSLLAALPLAATVAIFWWLTDLLLRWVGPDSLVGGALVALGLGAG